METQAVKMTQVEYAAHRGVSKQAVNKRIKAGKLPVLPDGKIDAAAADLVWGENTERVNTPDEALPTGGPRAPSPDAGGLTRAKTVTEVYNARLAELKYGREVGKYVEAAGIADAGAACGEAVVRIVRTLASKAELIHAAGVKDGVAGVRAALKSTEFEFLTRISDAFSKMAAAAAAGAPVQEGETEQ